jgi:hypothetical protein
MSDIVERLRQKFPLTIADIREAADEIERLRAAHKEAYELAYAAEAKLSKAVKALKGVVAVADRKTVEFDLARAVIAEASND